MNLYDRLLPRVVQHGIIRGMVTPRLYYQKSIKRVKKYRRVLLIKLTVGASLAHRIMGIF